MLEWCLCSRLKHQCFPFILKATSILPEFGPKGANSHKTSLGQFVLSFHSFFVVVGIKLKSLDQMG